jgi:hypothetical protein
MTRVATDLEGRFERFCVVGLGNHARTKLIPALLANGQHLVGVVTRGSGEQLAGVPQFAHLDDALEALPGDTAFVIATPPPLHAEQAMTVIDAGRDVIVEKPAFVTYFDAEAARARAAENGTLLVEGFMHRHTELYARFRSVWKEAREAIRTLRMTFLIPQMPAATFRQGEEIACSSLYDVGSYPVSLLSDLDLPLDALEIAAIEHPGDGAKEAIRVAGVLTDTTVDIHLGVGPNYVNEVSLETSGGETTTFAPFFFGRPGDRKVSTTLADKRREEVVPDGDAFRAMFEVSRRIWRDTQGDRARRLLAATATLERLGEALMRARRDAARGPATLTGLRSGPR